MPHRIALNVVIWDISRMIVEKVINMEKRGLFIEYGKTTYDYLYERAGRPHATCKNVAFLR